MPDVTPARSIECKGDDVVAALEVDLSVAACADHNILFATKYVGGRWRIDSRARAETPQFLTVGGVVGRELAIAFTGENGTACGCKHAPDHRLRRFHRPLHLAR